jgi:hypothetical protein
MIGPVVLLTARYLNNHFCPTDCLSGIQVMLIHTSVKPGNAEGACSNL